MRKIIACRSFLHRTLGEGLISLDVIPAEVAENPTIPGSPGLQADQRLYRVRLYPRAHVRARVYTRVLLDNVTGG